MELERLQDILEDWAKWMRKDDTKTGYPYKSVGLASGGESSHGAFDDMLKDMDLDLVHKVNAMINSLDIQEQNAIYARYLKSKKPFYYELKLQYALQNLLKLAEKRLIT